MYRIIRMLPAIVLLAATSGCAPRGGGETRRVSQSPEGLRSSQIDRTKQFKELVGRGVIEFRWTDDKGNHMEQGDLDFWKHGDAIALRITKLGELLMWFGGEGTEYWLFDVMGDEPTLTLGGETAMFSDIEVALVLLGLTPLPEGKLEVHDNGVTLDDRHDRTWSATFDPATHRPLEVKVVGEKRTATALHRKGIRVEIANQHELYWPFTGGLIDLEDNRGDTKIKIAFSSLSTIVESERMDRVCNLEFLRKALKPTIILQGENP